MTVAKTDTVPGILAKILEIQKAVGTIPKDGEMKFGGTNYTYVKNDDIVTKIAELINEHGVITRPRILQNLTELREIGPNRILPIVKVELVLTYVSVEDGSEFEVGPIWGEGQGADDKGLRKAVTSAQKIANLLTFTIVTGDAADPDSFYTQPIETAPAQATRAEVGVTNAKPSPVSTLRADIKKAAGTKGLTGAALNILGAETPAGADWINDPASLQLVLKKISEQK